MLEQIKQQAENNHQILLGNSIINNFIKSIYFSGNYKKISTAFEPYSKNEENQLASLGLLKEKADKSVNVKQTYNQVILITIESLHRDFLHSYNSNVPQEATVFLDSLVSQYPHLDNYFTSAMPTRQGLNAILTSQLDLRPEFSIQQREENLFTILQNQAKMEGFFISPVMGEYNSDYLYFPRLYKMHHFIGGEHLEQRYLNRRKDSFFQSWGYDDTTVYLEGLRLLEQQKEKPTFLVLTTIDSHIPYVCQQKKENLPETIRQHIAVNLLCIIYQIDQKLKYFVEQLQMTGWLDDDKHLLIITADHVPYLGGEHRGILDIKNQPKMGKIPLIFISKNITPFHTLNQFQIASQIDFAPTLLEIMGIQTPETFLGRSLLRKRQPEFAVSFYRENEREVLFYRQAEMNIEVNLLDKVSKEHLGIKKWFANRYAVK